MLPISEDIREVKKEGTEDTIEACLVGWHLETCGTQTVAGPFRDLNEEVAHIQAKVSVEQAWDKARAVDHVSALDMKAPRTVAPSACPHCNARVEGGKFCSECGKPLATAAALAFCTGCGAGMKPQARFCSECGTARGG